MIGLGMGITSTAAFNERAAKALDALVNAGRPVTREQLAALSEMNAGGGHFANTVSAMHTAGLVCYPQKGMVALSPTFSGGIKA